MTPETMLIAVSFLIALTAVVGKTRRESERVVAKPTWMGWIVILALGVSLLLGVKAGRQSRESLKAQIDLEKQHVEQLLGRVDRAETIATFFAVSEKHISGSPTFTVNLLRKTNPKRRKRAETPNNELSRQLIKDYIIPLEQVCLPTDIMNYGKITLEMGLTGTSSLVGSVYVLETNGKDFEVRREHLHQRTGVGTGIQTFIHITHEGQILKVYTNDIFKDQLSLIPAAMALRKWHPNKTYVKLRINGLGSKEKAETVKKHLEGLLSSGELWSFSDPSDLFRVVIPLKIWRLFVSELDHSVNVFWVSSGSPQIELKSSGEIKTIDNVGAELEN